MKNTLYTLAWFVLSFGFCISAAAQAPPANDECEDAIIVECGDEVSGSTELATDSDVSSNSGNDVWYRFTGTGDLFTFSLCGSEFDTYLTIYSGDCNELITERQNDDACETESEIRNLPTQIGVVYYILVDGFDDEEAGDYTLSVTCATPEISDNDNDECTDAPIIECGDVVIGSTDLATDSDGTDNTGNDVWYRFIGTGDLVTFSLCGSDFDTYLTIFSGGCNELIFEEDNDDLEEGVCDNQVASEIIDFPTQEGVEYFILVDGFDNNAAGDYTLSLTCPSAPPANDECEDAITVACGDEVTGSTELATDNTVWYRFIGTGDLVTFSLCGSEFDTHMFIFSGDDCDNRINITNNDDASCGFSSEISDFPSEEGVQYYILIDGISSFSSGNNDSGNYILSVTCTTPPPANDECADAITIECGDEVSGSTELATHSNGTLEQSYDVWYYFEGTGDLFTFELSEAFNFSTLEIFEGDDCGNLNSVENNYSNSPIESIANFPTQSGQGYYIVVDGAVGFSNDPVNPDGFYYAGDFTLSVTCTPPPPANDECEGAITVACGDEISGSTEFATDSDGTPRVSKDVWYRFTGTGDLVTFSLCGSEFDTNLAIYTGDCNGLLLESSNDDACGLQSEITDFPTEVGVEYFIMVEAFTTTEAGNFTLSVTCTTPIPTNDECEDAITIECGDEVTGSTELATNSDGSSRPGNDVWYRFTGTGDLLNISLCGTDFDTYLSIFSGDCNDLTNEAENDDACGSASEIPFFTTEVGVEYYIVVDGYNLNASGDFTLSVTCIEPQPAPTNDECEGAITIECGDEVSGSTVFATDSDGSLRTGTDVWYRFTGTGDLLSLSLCGTDFDTYLSIYTGDCNELILEEYNDDAACETASEITDFPTEVGVEYFIVVEGYDFQRAGDYTLSVTCKPGNDECAGAITIACGDEISGSTEFATNSDGTLQESYDVWYYFEGTGDLVTFELSDYYYRNALELFEGDDCGNLVSVASDLDDSNFSARINNFPTQAGQGYYIVVDGVRDFFADEANPEGTFIYNAGDFTLSMTCKPVNDECAGAITVECGDEVSGSTVFATDSDGSLQAGTDVWYRFIGTGDLVTFSLCGSEFDTYMAIYTGDCNELIIEEENDDACIFQSEITDFPTEVGVEYFILVEAFFSFYAGDYTLSVTCKPPCDITASVIASGESCAGEADGSISISANCTTCDGILYSIDGGVTTQSSPLFTGLAPDTYQVYAIDAGDNSCEANTTITINPGVPLPTLVCPDDFSTTLITDSETFDCSTQVTINHPQIEAGTCPIDVLTLTIEGPGVDLTSAVTPGDEYSFTVSALGDYTISYSLEDVGENITDCSYTITVDGLPCGWVDNGGIGDCDGENGSDYDAETDTYSVTSNGCVPSFPYTGDNLGAISTQLCGDGYIEVFVDNIVNKGFAGIGLRDGQAPGAKKVEIGTDNVARIIKSVRVIEGYPAFPQQLVSFDKYWLKIERTGNIFRASASADGITYTPYVFQTVMMGECLDAVLWTYSTNQEDIVTADFTNLNVVENNEADLQAPVTNLAQSQTDLGTFDVSLTPNPAKEHVNINLEQLIGQEVTIRLYNINGQLMQQQPIEAVETATHRLDLSRLPQGAYWVQVQSVSGQQTMKLIKQ